MATGTSRLNTYLSGINQLSSLSWVETWTGPANQKNWVCVCKINGEIRGRGVALRKSAAKDAAADQAWAFLTQATEGEPT